MTHLEIIDLIERICIYYPHANIETSEKTVRAWYDLLSDCESREVFDKLRQHIKDGKKFPPTVAELYAPKDTVKSYEETQAYLQELERRNHIAANFTPEQKETVNLAKQRIESILYQQQTNH